MDIFIHGIPAPVTNEQFNTFLRPHLYRLGVHKYECHKPKAKGCAFLFIGDRIQAEVFFNVYSQRTDVRMNPRYPLVFKTNSKQDGGAHLRDEKFKEQRFPRVTLENKMEAMSIQSMAKYAFQTTSLSCGAWDYQNELPVFISYYTKPFAGKLLIGGTSAVLLLYSAGNTDDWTRRIDFAWNTIDTIFTTGEAFPSLIITCHYSPKLYQPEPQSLTSLFSSDLRKNSRKKVRVGCLDSMHEEVAATCFSYRVTLAKGDDLITVQSLLHNGPEMPSIMPIGTHTLTAAKSFKEELMGLTSALSELEGPLLSPVRFQVMKLAMNGSLSPSTTSKLIPFLASSIKKGTSIFSCANALCQLYTGLKPRGPHSPAVEFDHKTLEERLQSDMMNYSSEGSVYHTVKTHGHLSIVHHVRVTPTGIYLEGPEHEVSNRVLRKYKHNLDSFVRVTFSDEDGERLEFHWNTLLDEIYKRIQHLLDSNITICGEAYSFLGFSSSSLKSQTAWFMAPFFDRNTNELTFADLVIRNLGDFSTFRSPAKCAARIGQAFTDTNGFITCHAEATIQVKDVTRNNRVFSDGCGTISAKLAAKVVAQYSRLQMKIKPKAFQIRYQGVKGVLSVDQSLQGEEIGVRPSMWKFQSKDTNDLEICGMTDKPRPLYLNRPLINVLEDLGVPPEGFLEMAKEAIRELQQTVSSPVNAAIFLETERVGDSARLPLLMHHMHEAKLDIIQDPFLRSIVEMAAFVRLRDLKYKGRMLVKQGIKLMGIMDETGFLKEGEIHCIWVTSDGKLKRKTGTVAITRSPTNHPGDVQIVQAVEAPKDSPLAQLYNCVVFSQHGKRDLPSMLGGGDLDGDLYDVFWDPRLRPRRKCEPADYPRLPAIDIGRQITTPDITKHFVDHMKNDNVGMLSSLLLVLSDRLDGGTRHPDCIEIAELISTALDFSKTGIKANISIARKYDKAIKPDFMAPGPRVKVGALEDVINFDSAEESPHDPVSQLDPEQRPTRYYESRKVLGQLYRLIDEKGFYMSLHANSQAKANGPSEIMKDLWGYAEREAAGVQFSGYLGIARDIRAMYESNLRDTMHSYALHPSHPLHEVEVVSGCVLGSTNIRRLKDRASDMRMRYAEVVAYTCARIREGDSEDDEDEALARSLACLKIAVDEPSLKVGKKGGLESFGYVAASMFLEELKRFHTGVVRKFESWD